METAVGGWWTTIVASFMGATGIVVAQWLRHRMEGNRERSRLAADSKANERSDIRADYQAIIDSLRADQHSLWKMFNEMQIALEECERKRREEFARLSAIEAQNRELTRRVRELEMSIKNGT